MMTIVTAAQMQALDRRTISEAHVPGTMLMERAGAGVVACLQEQLGALRGKIITILCGKGHNGGDGFVVARLLHKHRAKIH
ncbi:MAG: ADP-dependent NAD(P)H-hydrate dehydratase / NAD(P)H-hydrate epimerase, partial [Nitrospirota bacterium]|nr:ADP-dependent NAD(P)H-hydrate dehydratase / NAD(P)H-hydrate epimerase [Nitrospirota bacterium]